MRNEIVSGMKITYPDYMVWTGDNNIVMLKVPSGTALLRVTVGTRTQAYASEGDTVVLDISQLLIRNNSYGAVTLGVYAASVNPAVSVVRNYTIYLCRGWSLADRYHFSGRKIVTADTSVDIAVVDACTISGGTSTVSVASAQIVSYAITGSGVVTVTYGSKKPQGYKNDPVDSLTTNYEVEVLDCMPEDGVVIGWYDSDGCRRYLAGRVMSRGSKAETEEYRVPELGTDMGTLNGCAGRLVTSIRRTIEVGVAQVDETMHLEELLYSDGVWMINPYDASEIPLAPEFGEMEVDMKNTENVVLKFRVQQ